MTQNGIFRVREGPQKLAIFGPPKNPKMAILAIFTGPKVGKRGFQNGSVSLLLVLKTVLVPYFSSLKRSFGPLFETFQADWGPKMGQKWPFLAPFWTKHGYITGRICRKNRVLLETAILAKNGIFTPFWDPLFGHSLRKYGAKGVPENGSKKGHFDPFLGPLFGHSLREYGTKGVSTNGSKKGQNDPF